MIFTTKVALRRSGASFLIIAGACSKSPAPPAPSVGAGPAVASASASGNGSAPPPPSGRVPVAPSSQAFTVETIARADKADSDLVPWTYSTWLSQGTSKQLLATEGLLLAVDAPTDSPVETKVVGNHIHYGFDGSGCPSNLVGVYTAELTASPLALLSEQVVSSNRMVPCNGLTEAWSWKDFNGRVSRECTRGARCETRDSIPIPDVSLPGGYRGDDGSAWQCHRIDGCSVEVDGTAGHGYVTFGKRLASDPVVHAVISGRWLFVQIDGRLEEARADDRRWVGQDHVEVWTGESPAPGECTETSPPAQWGIRIADARVFSGAGKSKSLLHAERASCGPETVVLRIQLPEKTEALTVAYSAATAHKQRLLMATSQLVYGDGASLGSVKKIDPKRASCVAKNGALAAVMTPVASDSPLASFE